MTSRPALVFGTGSLGKATPETSKEFLAVCERVGIQQLDTARIYGESEDRLGELDAGSKFIIQTKVPGRTPGSQTQKNLLEAQETSFSKLKVDKVDIYYLHAPDPSTPFAETLEAINSLHRANKFARFGLSNFSPSQVEDIHAHCKAHSYVLPTVYQGNYNPVSRHVETKLFPVLRRLGIAFYTYSAIAGGFLAKTPEWITAAGGPGTGRWDKNSPQGARMNEMYNKPKMLEGLREWHAVAKDVGVPSAELAYRYMVYHSVLKGNLGDAVIVGASRPEQLEETVKGVEHGPLPESAVERIQKVWKIVEGEAPSVNLGERVTSGNI